MFAPSRGRELKSPTHIEFCGHILVRPLAGAGIEITTQGTDAGI